MWTFFLDSNFLIAIFSVDVFVFLPSSRFWWTNLRRYHQSPGDDCFHVNSCRNPTADFRRSIDYQHLLLVLNIWGRNNVHPHLSPSHTLAGFLSNRWGISHNFRLCQLRCAQTSQIYTYRISFVIESVLKYTSQFRIHFKNFKLPQNPQTLRTISCDWVCFIGEVLYPSLLFFYQRLVSLFLVLA